MTIRQVSVGDARRMQTTEHYTYVDVRPRRSSSRAIRPAPSLYRSCTTTRGAGG
jgi:hypothetical protein